MSGNVELHALYPEAVLDHVRRPRNRRTIGGCSHQGRAENSLCGDEVGVGLEIEAGVIRAAAFEGQSCAIATASASLMTEVLLGRTLAEARALFECVQAVASGRSEPPLDGAEREPRLAVLSCVSGHPERIECATLAWHGMLRALDSGKEER